MQCFQNINDWFSLESYKRTAELNTYQWSLLLMDRRRIHKMLGEEEYKNEAEYRINENCGNPFSAIQWAEENYDEERLLHVNPPYKPLFLQSVKPLTIMDMQNLHYSTLEEMKKRGLYWEGEETRTFSYNELDQLMADLRLPCDLFFENNRRDELRADAFIVFDDSYSDDFLVDQFKSYLEEYRKSTGRMPLFDQSVDGDEKFIEKIHKFRVLQYIDIHLWKTALGEKPQYLTVGRLLFPEEVNANVDLSERIRKHVNDLMIKSFLWAERVQHIKTGMIV